MQKIQAIFYYGRDFIIAASLVSILAWMIAYSKGASAITELFWFKTSSTIVFMVWLFYRRRQEVYFYLNRNISRRFLLLSNLVFDFGLFFLGLILILEWR